MPDVSYGLELGHLRVAATHVGPFPGLRVVVGHSDHHGELEIQCHLDSGEAQGYSSSTGAELKARLHRVRLGNKSLASTK